QRHQLLREQTRWTAEQAAELGLDTSGNSISIAEDIATIMSAELAIHVHALGEIKTPKQRFRQFCRLSRELSRFRRDDQRALRTQLRYGTPLHLATQHSATGVPPVRPDPTPEAAKENSGTGVSPVRPNPKPETVAPSSTPAPQPLGAPKPSEGG